MVHSGRLAEWVESVTEIHNKEIDEKTSWEFFLHKVYDKSFNQFMKDSRDSGTEPKTADMDKVEATVKKSTELLENFKLN